MQGAGVTATQGNASVPFMDTSLYCFKYLLFNYQALEIEPPLIMQVNTGRNNKNDVIWDFVSINCF